MLALVVAVEAGLTRAGREIQALINADWRRQRQAATSEAVKRADILCIGDSLVKMGVVPAALEARLDLTAYNLGMLNAPAPANYLLLKSALDAGARPRAIVLDANEPQLWGSRCREFVAGWAELLSPTEAWRLARDDRDTGFFGLYLVHRLLPSARLRLDVRREVVDRLGDAPPARYTPWRAILGRQALRNRGAYLFSSTYSKQRSDPYPDGMLPPLQWALWYRWGPLAQKTNLLYLHRLLIMAESRSIPVFFVVPPIHPGVLAVRERIGLEAEYLGLVGRLRDMYPNLVVVDARHSGFDHARFVDECHLHAEGALSFSNSLAEVIGEHLDGQARTDRWVALAPCSEPSAQLAVETTEESAAVEAWSRLIR